MTPDRALAYKERERLRHRTPYGRYTQQKRGAKKRGIAWDLTFEQWWLIWQESGHWNERGTTAGKNYVMARHGDVGPYAVENVAIIPHVQNTRDGLKNAFSKAARGLGELDGRIARIGQGRGWTFIEGLPNPYQVVVGKKYIGLFGSAAEAEAAYAKAAEAYRQELLSAA